MIFFTNNENKLKETEQILGIKLIKGFCAPQEIQSIHPEEVAKHKLNRICVDGDCFINNYFVEDSGLYLGKDKEIGALIKWFTNDRIVKAYLGEEAIAVSCFCGYFNGVYNMFDGYVRGKIVKPRGTSGFGWDSIFEEETTGKTFAEMTQEEKNKVSPRYLALMRMKQYLIK